MFVITVGELKSLWSRSSSQRLDYSTLLSGHLVGNGVRSFPSFYGFLLILVLLWSGSIGVNIIAIVIVKFHCFLLLLLLLLFSLSVFWYHHFLSVLWYLLSDFFFLSLTDLILLSFYPCISNSCSSIAQSGRPACVLNMTLLRIHDHYCFRFLCDS